ncbi:MAG TPA: TRAP transporter small permease [Polyangia bacterium]|nr:TRAP transporter small permease [Polyangia bacterium]
MKSINAAIFRGIEILLVLCISLMAIMVFGNVVLRYVFNSGITISEEASRMLFIWLTFLGAIVAMKDKAHIGVDTLVKHLPVLGKKICAILSDILVLACCVLFFKGSYHQTVINISVKAPVTELPMAIIYSPGMVCSALIGVLVLINLSRVITGRAKEDELITVKESDEMTTFEAKQAEEKARAERNE